MAEETRDVWGHQIQFVLTLIGYAVGLGNIWRFPYLCFDNGGGAFLIPYVLCLVLLGIPMFAFECAFGQFGAKGPLSIWSINPLFKGIGAASIVGAFMVSIYYNVVIALGIRFLIASFTSNLPWLDCHSCECLLYGDKGKNMTGEEMDNLLFNNSLGVNCTYQQLDSRQSPSQIYYYQDILSISESLADIGSIRWELVGCNLLAYIVIFLVLVKGIASLGKIVYFTATFPYILLTVLLVRVALLDGAAEGVKFYITPDFDKLKNGKVWSDAATQIFFSISACMGGLICMSSYNQFNNNIIRDSLIIPIINCLTSFYAGFVVFCTLGYMAHLKNTGVRAVATQGPGLIFVVYPEAIGAMPASTVWSILFFATICILGFSTQFSNAETLMTAVQDEFPAVFKGRLRQIGLRMCILLSSFILGLPICAQGGMHLLDLVDSAVLGFPILMVGLFEYIAIIYIYGYNKFADDIQTMVGFKPFLFFKATWCVISPALLLGLIVFKAYEMKDFDPAWKGLLYYLIVIFNVMWIPLGYFYYGRHAMKEAMAPKPYWRQRRQQQGQQVTTPGVVSLDPQNNAWEMQTKKELEAHDNRGFLTPHNDMATRF